MIFYTLTTLAALPSKLFITMKDERKKTLERYTYNDYSSDLKKHWEECELEFAHLEAKKWRGGKEQVFKGHREKANLLLKKIKVGGSTLLDYGIGDGFLGYVLLKEYGLGKYVGVDIAERTLTTARKNLSNPDWDVELGLVPQDFAQHNPDIITSFACIQHFPSKEYLDQFLENVANASPSVIMFQIRNGEHGEQFSPDKPSLACLTTPSLLGKRLSDYKINYTGKVLDNGYQTVVYSKKRKVWQKIKDFVFKEKS